MPSSRPSAAALPVPEHRVGRRSVAHLERGGKRWSCFLVTYPDGEGAWRGYFSFRTPDEADQPGELRTADIFLEDSESEIRVKARGLGRPLLGALLDSALHVRARDQPESPFLRRWFRDLLADRSLLLDDPGADGSAPPDLDRLRSLYASYRLDQVAHFIALVEPAHFEAAVATVLEGQGIDFAARDRLQLAMLVVAHIERGLPLPPFEIWARDYLDHRDRYRSYAHALHREGLLP